MPVLDEILIPEDEATYVPPATIMGRRLRDISVRDLMRTILEMERRAPQIYHVGPILQEPTSGTDDNYL